MWPDWTTGGLGSFASQGIGFFSSSFFIYIPPEVVSAKGHQKIPPKRDFPKAFFGKADWKPYGAGCPPYANVHKNL